MRRHALGILSLLLLLAAGYGLVVHGLKDSQANVISSMCLRIGLVLGAVWLALPQLTQVTGKVPPWFLAMASVLGLVIIARPRTAVVVGPILLILAGLYFAGWLMNPLPDNRKRTTRTPPTKRPPGNGET